MEKSDNSAREKILKATHDLVCEHSSEVLTIRNICKTAGVAYGSFYYNFGSKEQLLYVYCKDSFETMLTTLSPPAILENGNFINQLQWPFCVYAYFCSYMGSDLIKYLYEHSSADVFYDTCFTSITQVQLENALTDGLLDSKKEHLHLIYEDLQILYKGVVRQWCSSPQARQEMNEWAENMFTINPDSFFWKDSLDFGEDFGLVSILCRMIFRFVYSFTSNKYRMVYYANRSWRENWQEYFSRGV